MAFKTYIPQRSGVTTEPLATINTAGRIVFNKAARLTFAADLATARFAHLLWDDEAFQIGIQLLADKAENSVPVNKGKDVVEIAQVAFFKTMGIEAVTKQTRTYAMRLEGAGLLVIDVAPFFRSGANRGTDEPVVTKPPETSTVTLQIAGKRQACDGRESSSWTERDTVGVPLRIAVLHAPHLAARAGDAVDPDALVDFTEEEVRREETADEIALADVKAAATVALKPGDNCPSCGNTMRKASKAKDAPGRCYKCHPVRPPDQRDKPELPADETVKRAAGYVVIKPALDDDSQSASKHRPKSALAQTDALIPARPDADTVDAVDDAMPTLTVGVGAKRFCRDCRKVQATYNDIMGNMLVNMCRVCNREHSRVPAPRSLKSKINTALPPGITRRRSNYDTTTTR